MEKETRALIIELIEKCIAFESTVLCENGYIKEEYQETIVEKYLDIITTFEGKISPDEFGICVDTAKEELKRYYLAYYILDERIFKQLNLETATNPGWKSEARIRLYMMYLKSFREVLFLLSNGFSDCALARTRTLYELGVYINIINKNTDIIAERFCRYCNVQSLKMANEMSLEDRKNKLNETIDNFNYEDEYKKENGWARALFPNIKDKHNITFYNLIELTPYKNYYAMYKIACNFVHGSLFSSMESLDNAKNQS